MIDTDQCCLYAGYKRPNSYGEIVRKRRPRLVHREVYEAIVGGIPNGLTIDHLCKVRCCINVDHLEPVTRRLNIQRQFGEPGKCKRGHLLSGNVYVWVSLKGTIHRKCRKCSLLMGAIRYKNMTKEK